MEENEISVEQGFYEECAKLLDCAEHTYRKFPYRKRTRWNNRGAGNGRYPGWGLIRLFGNTVHISFRDPSVNRWFKSKDDALAFLRSLTNQEPV